MHEEERVERSVTALFSFPIFHNPYPFLIFSLVMFSKTLRYAKIFIEND